MQFLLLSLFIWSAQLASAYKALTANTLVTCENTEGITSKYLNIVYDHETKNIDYNASVKVDISGHVYADVTVFIYGLQAIHWTLDPCSSGKNSVLKQLCPVRPGTIDISGNTNIGDTFAKKIPGVAFTVPDIDAYAVVKVRDISTRKMLSCLYIEVKNSKTVEQTAVKWVTAVLSGLGLLISALFLFLGVSVESQNISAATVLMLNYFQSMAFLDMEAVERVPPIVSAWCDNVAWSVGLVYVKFLEKIFRWYVQATGGDPATYMIYHTKSVLVQRLRKRASSFLQSVSTRSLEWLENAKDGYLLLDGTVQKFTDQMSSLHRRADPREDYAQTSNNLQVYRGIERLSYKTGIEVTSTVLTSYTIFIFVTVCVAFLFGIVWLGFYLGTHKKRQEAEQMNSKESLEDEKFQPDGVSATFTSYEGPISRGVLFFELIPSMLKGTLLKLWYVAFPPVILFSLWEWYHNDSPAVIVLSAFMFVVCMALILFNVVKVFLIARRSQKEVGTTTYMLYGEPKTLQKYGYIYSMFDAKYYYFSVIYLAYNLVKAVFLAFSQASGKTQALALFIIELAMFITVAVVRPFLSKAINGIQITSHVIATINACFFLFFSNLMTQPLIVNGVMGVVFFVLNAAFSLVLLLYIIIYTILCIVWHKRRVVKPNHCARDHRQSFIMDPNGRSGAEIDELQALGRAAKAGHDNLPGSATPNWFNHEDSMENLSSRNPFEPLTGTPVINKNAERFPVQSDSNSDDIWNAASFKNYNGMPDIGSRHRNTESQASFGLQYNNQYESNLLNPNAPKPPSQITRLFKRG